MANHFLAFALTAARVALRSLGFREPRGATKLRHACLLALAIASTSPACAEIDSSQADARVVGMPICTSNGLPIGQVTGIDYYGDRRCIVGIVGGLLGFGARSVCIPLNWANKTDYCISLVLSNEQIAAFLLSPGGGIGSR